MINLLGCLSFIKKLKSQKKEDDISMLVITMWSLHCTSLEPMMDITLHVIITLEFLVYCDLKVILRMHAGYHNMVRTVRLLGYVILFIKGS